MVSTGGRTPKTDWVLCAKATLVSEAPEVVEWLASRTSTKEKEVRKLLSNNRGTRFGSPDRYYFLPGAWDIPDLLLDFQSLEYVGLDSVRTLTCAATLASPFAEALAARFQRYVGRLGTPDVNVEVIVERLGGGAQSGPP
jgi:hypothetical protein